MLPGKWLPVVWAPGDSSSEIAIAFAAEFAGCAEFAAYVADCSLCASANGVVIQASAASAKMMRPAFNRNDVNGLIVFPTKIAVSSRLHQRLL